MILSPIDIQQKQFRVKFRGFDVREVDAFLEEMATGFEALEKESKDKAAEIQRLTRDIQDYKAREETFKQAMVDSQRVIEQMTENARKKGELAIADAEVKAEKILNRTHNSLSKLHSDIAELKRQRVQIEVQLRSVVEAHTKLLFTNIEGVDTLEEKDSKIKVVNP